MNTFNALFLAGAALLITGCQMNSTQQVLQSTRSQAAQRVISTREYETTDRAAVLQAVVSTLQDLEYVIDRVDPVLGTVSATRYGRDLSRLTVSVREASNVTIVRASGQTNQTEISDPLAFESFYDSLSQSLFLQPHNV
ncbi:hypothetical protein FDP22_06775 [Paroceanicella profunda]|uniref:DUF3568 family protein n=1 Tax=Paroceanicella profunda TaxID=2579971 RepID=A0A5B8FGQ2_9RHOB|nr:hypothetical protein [Paroceanicella profunda]QDL91511.1 hypothetical protein FDP22_06775 [Paroceanicella profunda]